MTGPESASGRTAEQLTLVVLQPSYLPWLGYFDQIRRSDVFVFYDTVQFDRRGWRNRNRIKGCAGKPLWLTVPVHASRESRICEVEIERGGRWVSKHLQSLRHHYAKAPYTARYLPELEALLSAGWERIADLDIALTRLMCDWMGYESRFVRASEVEVQGCRNERLLAYCRHFGATRYLSGDSARGYLDVDLFRSNGVEVVWQDYHHPVYAQQHGAFVSHLSALDLLLNCGAASAQIISDEACCQ